MPTPSEIISQISPRYKGKKEAPKEYKLTYDSMSETLEPIYFWILDFMSKSVNGGVDKLIDNFTASPGSGHFSELMGKATRMQEEAMKIYGTINTVIKSILNIVYDLKEFQLRIKQYDQMKSRDKNASQAALLGLKQVWMDQVDIKKGRGSINMLAQDLNFITLRDAFMASDDEKAAGKLDVNDRVKRILLARLQEFGEWLKRSEVEIRKRYEIEKTYLRTQVSAVKMYSRWAKPYLVAAEQLRMKDQDRFNANMVNIFNTIQLQLTILSKNKIDTIDAAVSHDLPEDFKKIKFKRNYYSCVLVDFSFRGIPQRVSQQGHYAFGGRVEVSFKAYALNDEEIKLLKKKLDESDFEDSLNLVEGLTKDSLEQIKGDIDEFLNEKSAEEKAEEKNASDVNPFAALFGLGKKLIKKEGKKSEDKGEEEMKKLSEKGIDKDNYAEGAVRKLAEGGAIGFCYTVYDIYKKAHDMASTPEAI